MERDMSIHSVATKSKKTAPAIMNPVNDVYQKYIAAGWTVIVPPAMSINHLIAQKGKKMHFIQVLTLDTMSGEIFQGLPKNTFIQNAFSNGAIPVHAFVRVVKTSLNKLTTGIDLGTDKIFTVITLQDVNQNTKIIIAPKKQPAANDPATHPAGGQTLK